MNLTIDRVTKQFGSRIAVDRLSLTFSTGIFGLLGSNGAGKTTLMRMLCGVLKPTSGEIILDGQNINDLGENYRTILGYLPQDFGYYPDFTAKEFMYFIAAMKGLRTPIAKRKTMELLQLVGLEEVASHKIRSFSGGMKQRLGIAQAVLNDPQILVLDEPTAGLDPKERIRFRNLISDFAKNKIIILSTHIVSDIEYIANKIIMLKKGILLVEGTVHDVIEHANIYTWNITVEESEVEHFDQKYCISNLHHTDTGVELRMVSVEKPAPEALQIKTTLEDIYLYNFSNKVPVCKKL